MKKKKLAGLFSQLEILGDERKGIIWYFLRNDCFVFPAGIRLRLSSISMHLDADSDFFIGK